MNAVQLTNAQRAKIGKAVRIAFTQGLHRISTMVPVDDEEQEGTGLGRTRLRKFHRRDEVTD